MKIKTIILCGIMSLLSFGAMAQKVEGVVVDATTNEPLIGASVYWLNTNVGVATDIEGKYDLHRVKGYDKLVATYVGYSNDTIQVAQGVTKVDFALKSDTEGEAVDVQFSTLKEGRTYKVAMGDYMYKNYNFPKNGAHEVTGILVTDVILDELRHHSPLKYTNEERISIVEQ